MADSHSPSGRRFRASYQAGIGAYLRAAQIEPASMSLLYQKGRPSVLFVAPGRVVLGKGEARDTATYGAYPSVDTRGDTVALIPYPLAPLRSGGGLEFGPERQRAFDLIVEEHRSVLVRLALSWVRSQPANSDAYAMLATALELRGDIAGSSDTSSAIAALRKARSISTSGARRFDLAVMSVRLALKGNDLAAARAAGDSMLTAAARDPRAVSPSHAQSLAAVAALVGRLPDVRRWSLVSPAPDDPTVDPRLVATPQQAREEVIGLWSVAALGRCDSVPAAHARAEAALERAVPPQRYADVWNAWIPRALSMAAPCDGGRALLAMKRSPIDRLILMQIAFARGRVDDVRAQLDSLAALRGAARPGDIAIDYTFQEAWLLSQIGQRENALRQLRRTLESLSTIGSAILSEVPQAAALCRAYELASTLSIEGGDRAAGQEWMRRRSVLCASPT
ncbi:MAG: hypothetical protein ACREBE_11900 [bacterium]